MPEPFDPQSRPDLPTAANREAFVQPPVDEPLSDPRGATQARPLGAVELRPGLKIGKFELAAFLGKGGMGEAWKAWDPSERNHVVLKFLPPDLRRGHDEIARFQETYRRARRLHHSHICPLYDLGDDSQFGLFQVMLFLEGISLSKWRREQADANGRLSLSQVEQVLRPVALALDYAHKEGVIHRDVKPGNIVVRESPWDVHIIDFGLAAELQTALSRTSRVQMEASGTEAYMAPEQWLGKFQDHQTDQYALAVMAYELLSGHLPFTAPNSMALAFAVTTSDPDPIDSQSDSVNKALLKALSRERKDRFAKCTEFVEALNDFAVASVEEASKDSLLHSVTVTATPFGFNSAQGECPHCGHRDGSTRKFCPICGGLLRYPCPTSGCNLEVTVWDEFCGVCGCNIDETLTTRRETLAAKRLVIENLVASHLLGEAIEQLREFMVLAQPPLADFRDWSESTLDRCQQELVEQERVAQERRAREKAEIERVAHEKTERERLAKEKADQARTAGDCYKLKLPTQNLVLRFRWCPAGTFLMGSHHANADQKQVEVTLSQGFWMLETEVTQLLWEVVIGSNPADSKRGLGPNIPVYNVDYRDVIRFCRRLTDMLQKSPVTQAIKIRLPTEAEWEYACRAGTRTDYCFGDYVPLLKDYAHYEKGVFTKSRALPVGERKPNAWGLYDMHGNVREWCDDWYADKLSGGIDPKGPARGRGRVTRGGSWWYSEVYATSWFRSLGVSREPENGDYELGFRVVFNSIAPIT